MKKVIFPNFERDSGCFGYQALQQIRGENMQTKAIILLLVLVLCFAITANAALIDRGTGMIYDTDQDITWLQDADYAATSGYDSDGQMNWFEATEVGRAN